MNSQIAVYQDESITLEIHLDESQQTIWLTQDQIATLFGVNTPAISKHIKNIYQEGELIPEATLSKMEIVRNEGGRSVLREIVHYNLDMVISVGYRVNSLRATRFRQWATRILKSYIVQGYALNENRLQSYELLLTKIEELKQRIDGHDQQLKTIIEAIRQIIAPPEQPGRRIGFRTND